MTRQELQRSYQEIDRLNAIIKKINEKYTSEKSQDIWSEYRRKHEIDIIQLRQDKIASTIVSDGYGGYEMFVLGFPFRETQKLTGDERVHLMNL